MPMRLRSSLPEFTGAQEWVNANGAPERERFRGKPLLVHVWAADCAQSEAAMPHVNRWRNEYGLPVVGVHAPRAGADVGAEAAKAAIEAWGVAHPVALDADRALARAFGSECTPAFYLYDGNGMLRHAQTGGQGLGLLEQRIRKWSATKRF